jgi:rhodanese-related sulfurtransferase
MINLKSTQQEHNLSDFDDMIDITVQDFQNIMTNGDTSMLLDCFFENSRGVKDTIVIDVRTRDEIRDCELSKQLRASAGPRIVNISTGDLLHLNRTFLERMFKVKQNKTLICVCATGKRSAQAQKHLSNLGFDTYSVYGGMKTYGRSLAKKLGKKMFKL